MKESVNFSRFFDAFRDKNRHENFSYDGKHALFDYLEQYEEDCGTETELDVIALCCEYSEYKNLAELQENYTGIEDMDDLENHTVVIRIPDSEAFIIQQY